MKRIETQFYAPVPWSNKPQYAGQRKAVAVFSELYTELEKKEMLPDGYFKVSGKIEHKPDIEFPNEMLDIFNEIYSRIDGTYLRVGLYFCNREKECYEVMPFAVGKVLDGSERGYEKMEEISAYIYRLFMGYQEGHMTFRVAMKKIYMPFLSLLHPTDEVGDWLVDIEFYNDKNERDKTQFGVNPCYLDYHNGKCRELEELWIEFCKENGFRQNSIIQISLAFP